MVIVANASAARSTMVAGSPSEMGKESFYTGLAFRTAVHTCGDLDDKNMVGNCMDSGGREGSGIERLKICSLDWYT